MTQQDKVTMLKEILAIDTTGKDESKVADILAGYLQKAGIASSQVPYAPGRGNLVAEIGTGGPVLALSGHMDVVPSGDPAQWSSPPFTPTEKDGRLYARGATDMKSGVAAMVAAMIELAEEKAELKGRVRLLATIGEETGLFGAKLLTDKGYAKDVEALIIGEPTGHRIVHAHKGMLIYSITSHGKSAHSSMPELGVNAIDNLLLFYNRMMEEFSKLNEKNSVLGPMLYCNSMLEGGEQANMVPDRARFTASLRTIPEVDNERAKKVLQGIVDELNGSVENMRLEMEVSQSTPPVFSDENSRLVQAAMQESVKMFGEKPELLGAPGNTDAAEFVQGNRDMEVIIFGPGNETMHQLDEYVEIDNYLEMVDLYKNIIHRYFEA